MALPRVLLADDHTIVADGLRSLLAEHFDLVGTVRDGVALVEAAHRLRPDVIVSDIGMPVLSGLDALRRLNEETPRPRMIFLTMHADPDLATEAFRAGAAGYLVKHAAGEELINAIHEVLRGRFYLSPMITRDVLTNMDSKPARSPTRLTPRQRDVLQLVVEGKRMKEIAASLDLSIRTVEFHKYEMMQALGVRTTAELIQFALRNDLVASTEPTESVRSGKPLPGAQGFPEAEPGPFPVTRLRIDS
jgi:DNA-binding NarL/FixJ family response regulator